MKAKLLEGKVAIVTGGSRGIGQGIAELFAEEGACVVITARGQEDLDAATKRIRDIGGRVVGVLADQRVPSDVQKTFKAAIDNFGDIDIVVVNAGVGENLRIEAVPDELFDEIFEINTKGPFMYVREAVKHFLPKNDGSIVLISSVNGVRPMCGPAYTSSKAALNMIAKQVAVQLVGTGIRINVVAPGYTVTSLSDRQERKGGGVIPPAGTPFDPMVLDDRMNPPEDVSTRPVQQKRTVRGLPTYPIDQAYAALFFASDMGKCVQGQVISVDRGSYL